MQTVKVSPDVLKWARETAGLSIEEAARKVSLAHAFGFSSAERLDRLENGTESPSRAMLLRMSKQYRQPLITFYQKTPPTKNKRGEDFRRLPEQYSMEDEALVDMILRDVRARQSIVRAAIEDEDEANPIPYIGSASMSDGAEHVSSSIQQALHFDINRFRAQKTSMDAFAYLRHQVEQIGIFTLLIGDLGSHHTSIPTEIFRGFALADNVAPFIVINHDDAKAAWAFTLIHELAHLWLGQTSISGGLDDNEIERFCDEIASRILLPIRDLASLAVDDATTSDLAVEAISEFANSRNISRSMVAFSLYRTGAIRYDTWKALRNEFRQQWLQSREDQRKLNRSQKSGGPDYFVVRRHRAGTALIHIVSRMMSTGTLSSTKAAQVLGVKPTNVYRLIAG